MTTRESPEHTIAPPTADTVSLAESDGQASQLAAYDELLRQRGSSVGRLIAGATTNAAGLAPELVECLELIEEFWPRGSERPSAAATLPRSIGRFEVERVLGQGGFGIVYLARDPLLDRLVALKVPRLHALVGDGMLERFRREARATAALDHPNIVPIHETGEAGPLSYIAFAYCEGPSLAQWLKLHVGQVPARVAAEIVRQLAEAMQYSHSRGVLHRDLKPSNVLLFPSRERGEPAGSLPFVPRIVDFGLARVAEEELEATGTSGVIGTPLYMAPEQALGAPDAVGPPADLYALGVILYELLCQRAPFAGSSPLDVLDQVRHAEPPSICKQRPDVARDLETICFKCLQKRPQDRYLAAQALADDLTRFLDGQEIVARPTSIAHRLVRWCQQPQRLREAGLMIVAVNFAMGGWTILTTTAIALEMVPRPDHLSTGQVLRDLLPVVLFTSPPLIAAGIAVIQGRKWAIQICFGTGIGMTTMAILLGMMLVENPFSWLFHDILGYSMLMYSMLTMLSFIQVLASVVAWMSLRHNEKSTRNTTLTTSL